MRGEGLFRSGTVVLAGRPNVGKSTLVNRVVEFKASIVSDKPQTTRNAIRCVYNGEGLQIVFIDTPGIHLPRLALGKALVDAATGALEEGDLVCYVAEAGDRTISPEDGEIISFLEKTPLPILLVLNKCDRAKTPETAASLYKNRLPLAGTAFVSAKTGEGVPGLISLVAGFLPEGPPLYDEDIIVDRPEKFIAAEIIREKILRLTHEEVPHSAAVEIEEYKSPDEYPERDVLFIRAVIYVEREGQRRIIIGDKGARIREAGRLSRIEIEALTGHKVYLDLWIKVRPDWRRSEGDLRMLGIKEKRP